MTQNIKDVLLEVLEHASIIDPARQLAFELDDKGEWGGGKNTSDNTAVFNFTLDCLPNVNGSFALPFPQRTGALLNDPVMSEDITVVNNNGAPWYMQFKGAIGTARSYFMAWELAEKYSRYKGIGVKMNIAVDEVDLAALKQYAGVFSGNSLYFSTQKKGETIGLYISLGKPGDVVDGILFHFAWIDPELNDMTALTDQVLGKLNGKSYPPGLIISLLNGAEGGLIELNTNGAFSTIVKGDWGTYKWAIPAKVG